MPKSYCGVKELKEVTTLDVLRKETRNMAESNREEQVRMRDATIVRTRHPPFVMKGRLLKEAPTCRRS